MMKFSTS